MGPYPHDAPPANITPANPAGTDGFEFVEFASPEPERLHALFRTMGFAEAARHRYRRITLYRQGAINLLVTEAPESHATRFAAEHGPCAPSMAFRVVDAQHAYQRCVSLGAEPADLPREGLTIQAPAIKGIGGSLLYLIDRYGTKGTPYDDDFAWLQPGTKENGAGPYYIDHLTHNVVRGRMDWWTEFYNRLFSFRQIRYFDIEGRHTGLYSRALTSPDGKIRIPINESADDRSQIEEYLRVYRGEGIQHVAFGCRDIHATVETLRARGLAFMPSPPATYYNRVDQRLPGHAEDVNRLALNGILIDGEGVVEGGTTRVLLQIFSKTVVGPIFFEFIERKGDEGFGEGNFRALFESIEEDQIRRGVLSGSTGD
jgi:4-hydroxyphenylpyruvate dioxygenase